MSWLPTLTGKRKPEGGKRKSEGGPSGGFEKLARGVRDLTIEDEPTQSSKSSPSTLAAGIFEEGAIWIHGDDPGPDAVEPSASAEAGTAEDTAASHIPNAQQAQPADMVPEASDSVQGAPSEVPDMLAHLNGMGEEELQEELTKVKAVIKEVEAKAQNLDLVQGLLRATKPSITRTIDEACARMMKLSQLQFKLIRYQSWKANLTPMPCFDHQVAGAVQFLEQDLLSVMEATSMEAVEEALGQLGCPGGLNMDSDIIRTWVEEIMNERQQYCVELATLESNLEEAKETDSNLKEDLHHLKIQQDTINRLLLELQVQSIVTVLSAMGSNPESNVS